MMDGYQVEDELRGRTPRRIAPKRTNPSVWGRVFLTAFVLFGIGLLLMALGETMVAFRGIDLPGAVSARRIDAGGDDTTYQIDYRYYQGDRRYTGSSPVSEEDYRQMEVGEPITVRTLPGMPALLPALDGSYDYVGLWFCALIWNMVMAAFVWFVFVWPSIVRRLVISGIPSAARITDKTKDDEGGFCYLHYEFVTEPPSSASIRGKRFVTSDQWDKVAIGDALTVLYNEKRPYWNVPYRFSNYQVI